MRALLWMQAKSFIKSPGSTFTFLLPIALLIILGWMLPATWIIPMTISISILATGLFQFGTSLGEVKRTSFMKSVGLTKLNKFTTFVTFLVFTVIITILGIIWVLFWGWFLTGPFKFLSQDWSALAGDNSGLPADAVRINWDQIDWGQFSVGVVMNIILSFSLAFFFIAITKTSESYNFLAIGYFFAMLFIGGVILPQFLVAAADSWLVWGYYLMPHYYVNQQLIAGFGGEMNAHAGALVHPINLLTEYVSESAKAGKWVGDSFYGYQEMNSVLNGALLIDLLKVMGEDVSWINSVVDINEVPLIGIIEVAFAPKEFEGIMDEIGKAEILNGGTLEQILGYFKYVTPFDFRTTQGILNFSMPFAFIGTFAALGTWRFQWTSR